MIIAICISLLPACNVPRQLTREDLEVRGRDIYLVSVKLKDGTFLDFSSDPSGFALLRDSTIYRDRTYGGVELIPLDKVDFSTAYRQSRTGENAGNVVIVGIIACFLAFLLLGTIRFSNI